MQTLKLTKKYHTYPEYKDSEVEWLGKIPKGWEAMPLQRLFFKTKRMGFENEELLSVYRDRGVIIKSSRDDNHNRASDDLSTYQLVEKGDLAINKMKAWQGSIAISEHRGIVSPAYFICKPLTTTNPKFLHYLLRSDMYIKQYERYSGGVRNDQWDLDYEQFRKLEALIPPVQEQTKIAAYLDEKTALIDEIIAKKKKLIDLLREKRTAVINEAVTRGLDPKVDLVDSGVEWIGKVPKGWGTEKMKFLATRPLKYGVNTSEDAGSNEDEPRYVRITDITDDGGLEADNRRSLPMSTAEDYLLADGDILLARTGATVGKAMLYKSDMGLACFAGYLIQMRPDTRKILPRYLFLLTRSGFYETWKSSIFIQATIQNISAEKYANLAVPVPPLDEQKRIIAHIDTRIGKYDQAIDYVEQSIAALQEFKSSLISHVVTGKVKIGG